MNWFVKIVNHPLFYEFWVAFAVLWMFATDFAMPLSKWFCGAIGLLAFLRILAFYAVRRRNKRAQELNE